MDAPERFPPDKPIETFNAQREFSESKRPLRGQRAYAQTFDMLRKRILHP